MIAPHILEITLFRETALGRKSFSRAGDAPKQSDVAAAAGVSPMTVSRVINRHPNVRSEIRAKVEAAIVALNYSPNTAARKLAGGAQLRIALLYGNPSRAWSSEVMMGCLAEASRSDVRLLLEQCDDEAAALVFALKAASEHLDGVILPPPFCDSEEVVNALLAAGVLVAVIASGAPISGTFAVTVDERAAASEMTRHLAGLGHRRIGFIVGDSRQTGSARRLEGYLSALNDAGIPVDLRLIAQGDYTYSSGLRAANELLALDSPPTAIFASNDDMAAAVIAAAHRHHRDVPEDISIAGFDDTALATTISPELTTVRQPIADMAKAAVELLALAATRRQSGDKALAAHRVFEHTIVMRQSAAPPPRPNKA